MANELTIKSVMQQANCYNLAIPFVSEQQNPFMKATLSLVTIDTRAGSQEVFKVSSSKVGNNWVENYALTKPALMKMATEAGIQFDPSAQRVERVDENTWKATACGGIKLPDGTVRTSVNSKVIDLVSEERKYRSAYKQEAANGISDQRKVEKAMKKYKGTMNQKIFMLDPSERERYVEEQTNEAMAQLRTNAPQKAITGANLRVIRDLLGIHGTYTMDELKKPFAIARAVFSPDYSDPAIKQMMLQQAMASSTNLFGRAPQIQMQPAYQPAQAQVPVMPDLEPEPAGMIDVSVEDAIIDQTDQMQDVIPGAPILQCADCCDTITEAELNYSKKRFGRPLCRSCQRKASNPYNNR